MALIYHKAAFDHRSGGSVDWSTPGDDPTPRLTKAIEIYHQRLQAMHPVILTARTIEYRAFLRDLDPTA
jgi:hypothetical protein